MKHLVTLVTLVYVFSGCSMLEKPTDANDGSKSMRICIGVTGGECGEGFMELDGSIIPYVGGVANSILTCVRYSADQNVSCPEGTIQITNADVVK